jgi:hypothetical protein
VSVPIVAVSIYLVPVLLTVGDGDVKVVPATFAQRVEE